jgi:hypothetical protein
MMAINEENKVGLLLTPQQLLKNISILQTLHIRKTAAETSFQVGDLDNREINAHFPIIPKEAKVLLKLFSAGDGDVRNYNIRSKYKTGRAGVNYTEFYENTLLRELHGLFERLKPFTPLFKWYHKIWTDQSNAKTAPLVDSARKNISIKENAIVCVY